MTPLFSIQLNELPYTLITHFFEIFKSTRNVKQCRDMTERKKAGKTGMSCYKHCSSGCFSLTRCWSFKTRPLQFLWTVSQYHFGGSMYIRIDIWHNSMWWICMYILMYIVSINWYWETSCLHWSSLHGLNWIVDLQTLLSFPSNFVWI